ncbi:helix-turn-helix domain-containing protein [Microbacterium sp.]|uniref:helix-turn-helix domain-containing protein n=1 Tax=Microbacterium sp. TaxID=51671 RepID=UPI0039E58791
MVLAADLIRDGRTRATITQAELARRSGVPQSVISAYERGRREPSFRMVDTLLAAVGATVQLVPRPMLAEIRDRRDELYRILVAHGASNTSVFGSVARGDETAESDIDLLTDFAEGTGLLDILRLQAELEAVLGRRVDIVARAGLKPDVARNALRDEVPL